MQLPRLFYLAIIALLAVAGCRTAAGTGAGVPEGIGRLPDKTVESARSGGLGVAIKERNVQFIRQLDWEAAEATLDNTVDASIPVLTQRVDATTDASNQRLASVYFSPIKPSANYRLKIDLKRRNQAGTEETVATGTATGVTLSPGANTVNVALTPTASGEVQVVIAQAAVNTNSLSSDVRTFSHFTAQRVAGSTTSGYAVGTDPLTAVFKDIRGVAIDASDNLYVADGGNHRIRKLVPGAASVVVAGTGTPGFSGDGGAATSAELSGPGGLVRDPLTGAIFFSDSNNDRIRRIAPDGRIYTYAGGGADAGASVANPLDALIDGPTDLTADASGNLFVVERDGGKIRRIDRATGAVTTLASGMGATSAGALALDRARGLLWYNHGVNVKLVTDVNGTPGAPATVYTAEAWVGGLVHDQIGTLYLAHSDAGGTGKWGHANMKIWRLPVGTDGQLRPGRSAEHIAGTGGESATLSDYSVPTTAVATPTAKLLAGAYFNMLHVDLRQTGDAGTLSGILYLVNGGRDAGNQYWSELVKLTPSNL